MSRLSGNKRAVAIVLGAVLVLLVVLIAATSGFGNDSPSGDAVAVVDGEEISQEDFDAPLQQAAARQGAAQNCQGPSPDDPQYEALRDEALERHPRPAPGSWARPRSRASRSPTARSQEEFEQTKNENFKTEQEYQDFLKQSGFTQEDIDERVKLQLISTKIQEEITGGSAGDVSEEDAASSTRRTRSSSPSPQPRNIRIVLNEDPEKAQQAADQLEQDNSPENWKQGRRRVLDRRRLQGRRRGARSDHRGRLPRGRSTREIFDAPRGRGRSARSRPTPAPTSSRSTRSPRRRTTPFEEARAQIDQQLAGQIQQELFSAFLSDYRDRWIELTICADDFMIERCDNFAGATQPCPDPSAARGAAAAAARADRLSAARALQQPRCPRARSCPSARRGQPQRPHPPGEDAAVPAGPGGIPGGASRAVPVQPGGAAPPGATAPPQGATAPPPGG